MAILYYPKNQVIVRRDATNPLYEQMVLGLNPATVIYFDTSSVASEVSSSSLYITASWALSSSWAQVFLSSSISDFSISSSYSITASYAANAGGGPGGSSVFMYQLPVQSAKLAGTKSAALNNGVYNWELLFNREESAVWQLMMPSNFNGGLSTTFQWYPTASNIGSKQVIWNLYITALSQSATTSSIFPYEIIGITSSLEQSGSTLQQTKIWLTGSSVISDCFVRFVLQRGTGSADTLVGPVAVISNKLEWISS